MVSYQPYVKNRIETKLLQQLRAAALILSLPGDEECKDCPCAE